MKKNWFGKTLLVVLVVGVLAVGAFAAYRIGYVHGAQASLSGGYASMWAEHLQNVPETGMWGSQGIENWGEGMMPYGGRMPVSRYGSGMMDGYSRTPFNSHMSYGMTGFFFLPALFRLLFWGFLIWVGYKLFKGSGWKFTRETSVAPAAPIVDETLED